MLREVLHSLGTLLGRGRQERLLRDEMAFHLEQETRENIRRGMKPEEARREARLAFGAEVALEEECREAWGAARLESLWRDLWYAVRGLRKDLAFTVVVVATMALGIGSNTAIFSVIQAVMLRPLPIQDGGQVVALGLQDLESGQVRPRFSFPELQYFREHAKLLENFQELHTMTFTLLGRNEPQNVQTGVVRADYFEWMGIKAWRGRTFVAGEDGHEAQPVLVLSHRFFLSSFGGDASVVGQSVKMNDRMHTIVGVLPELPEFPEKIDLYMPTSSCPTRGTTAFEHNARGTLLRVYARLKPGVKLDSALTELDGIFAQYKAGVPAMYPAEARVRMQATMLDEELSRQARPTLLMLFAITGIVLLISCASVANLSLSRLLRREREIAIRAAIGGSRGRLMQQFLVEGLVLATAGGVVGLVAAMSAMSLLSEFVARLSPRAVEMRMDWTVWMFCGGVSVLAGLLTCGLPAWRTRIDLSLAMKDGSAAATMGVGRGRSRRLLVSAQVAFSFVVLISAGLLCRSLVKLMKVDLGFQPERLVSMTVNPNWSHVTNADEFVAFYERLLEKVRGTPGVVSAAVSGNVPLAQNLQLVSGLEMEGRQPGDLRMAKSVRLAVAGTDYFETMRIPVLDGRTFRASDNRKEAEPVAVISASMARRYYAGGSPVGRRVRLPNNEKWITIVGEAGDARTEGLDREPLEMLYLPMAKLPGGTTVVVRTAMEPAALIGSLRRSVYGINPEQAIASVRTMEELVDENLAAPELTAKLVGLLAALTLLITVTGIGGVTALAVDQRRTEIGVRLALGASPAAVVRMMVRQEMWMVAAGLAAGVLAQLLVGHALSKLLFGTQPTDPLTFGTGAVVMLGAALLACLLPAARAAHLDSLRTLRSE